MENSSLIAVDAATESALNFKRLSRWRVRVTTVAIVFSISWLLISHHQPHLWRDGSDPLTATSLVSLVSGLLIRSWAAGLVRKRLVLATTGAYSLCRHPLYLGSLLMLIGFCGLVRNPIVTIVMCGAMGATIAIAIRAEEQFLATTFGNDWTTYTQKVSPILPMSLPRSLGEISFRRWRENHEARVWVATFIGISVLEVWFQWR